MKEKKATTIIIKVVCLVVFIMICLVVAFFVQFNSNHLDSLVDTDTLGEAFFNGSSVSRVIDCDVTRKDGIMLSKVYQNEMPGLETQFRFRFMSTRLMHRDHFYGDVNMKLTDADGRDVVPVKVVFDEIMGMDCMQIYIPIPHDEIGKFADGLFFEVSLKNADDKPYAECKFAIPVEKIATSDS